MTDETETESFEPKLITIGAVPEAIKKAELYRLLNQPEQAESICRDILEIDPKNQRVLVVLILAMTDQYERSGSGSRSPAEYLEQIEGEYERTYYSGLDCERRAKALLGRGLAAVFAYDGFRDAMHWYEKAEQMRPKGNDESILRWNYCARTIREHHLRPQEPTGELPLE